MKRTTIFCVTSLAVLTLGACNTVNGAGKDVKSAGSAMSKASGQEGKR